MSGSYDTVGPASLMFYNQNAEFTFTDISINGTLYSDLNASMLVIDSKKTVTITNLKADFEMETGASSGCLITTLESGFIGTGIAV